MSDYSKSKIYKIYNTVNDNVYIGSTTKSITNRISYHRIRHLTKSNHPLYTDMRNIGIHKFFFQIIENYPCDSKRKLKSRERQYVRLLIQR